jgi:hypothetical protein
VLPTTGRYCQFGRRGPLHADYGEVMSRRILPDSESSRWFSTSESRSLTERDADLAEDSGIHGLPVLSDFLPGICSGSSGNRG